MEWMELEAEGVYYEVEWGLFSLSDSGPDDFGPMSNHNYHTSHVALSSHLISNFHPSHFILIYFYLLFIKIIIYRYQICHFFYVLIGEAELEVQVEG